MTRADDVLDSIDHALHDWDTSGDAMRWKPEAPQRPQTPELTPEQIEALRRTFTTVGAAVTRGMQNLAKAFERAGKAYIKFAHRVSAHDRTRCRVCKPFANPAPLGARGAAYHRRQKRRSRR